VSHFGTFFAVRTSHLTDVMIWGAGVREREWAIS
jgi:hypothetical protein